MKRLILFLLIVLAAQFRVQGSELKETSKPKIQNSKLEADSTRAVDLDEIIIVSQPKETVRLRRQPTSSSVFAEADMQRLAIGGISDVALHVPSLTIPAYGSRLTSSVYIRGIGSRTGDPAIGIYYDNIPLMSKSAYNTHFYQLDRADILRGPQGTLYGINTEGGLMRLYSKNPMSYQASEVRLFTEINAGSSSEYASRQPASTTVEVAKYHRPSDEFAFSVAAFYTDRRGYFNNTNLNEPADDGREGGARTHLVWRPDHRWSFELTADYQHTSENAFPYGLYDSEADSWTSPSTTFANAYRRNMFTVGLHTAYKLGSRYSQSSQSSQYSQRSRYTPNLLLSSTTSYQFLDDRMTMDQDYLPADFMRLSQEQLMQAITQEFTLKTQSASRWQHTSGIFFSHEWLRTDAPIRFGPDMNDMIKAQMGIPQQMLAMLSLTDNSVPATFRTPRLNLGIYHESNISLTDRIMLTLGLRYDLQHTSIDYDARSHFSLGMPSVNRPPSRYESILLGSTSDTYNELLPKLALTYRLDQRGSNIYASVSKGFRAGGYNLQMFADIFQTEQRSLGKQLMQLMQGDLTIDHDATYLDKVASTITYAPEESWSYEAGTHLNLFDGHLQADAAAFYMQVKNQQLSVMAGDFGRMMVNAGEADNYGIELTLRGKAFSNRLTWNTTYSWTDSKFSEEGEVKSEEFRTPFIPAHTFSASADWRFTMPSSSLLRALTIGGTLTGCGDIYWDVDNLYRQPFYALLGARMSLDFGRLTVDLHGHNLTSTSYNTFLIDSAADGQRRTFSQRGMPTRLSVDLKLKI